MEQMQHKHEHQGGQDRRDLPQHGAGRVVAYLIVSILLNILLAIYALYMLGLALAFDWTILNSGTLQVILESALQMLLFFSPVILAIFLNRLLYRVFRGRKRFPRGMWFFAMLLMLVVQAATLALIFGYGYVDGVNGLNIEQLAVTPLG